MTSDARAQVLAQQAAAASGASQAAIAELSMAQHGDVLQAIAEVRRDVREQREDLKEIKAHVEKTNGRVSKIELWMERTIGHAQGLAEGAGGAGRLILGVLGGGSLVVGIMLTLINIASHLK